MTIVLGAGQKLALDACLEDTISFYNLYLQIQEHPESPLIFNGLIAHASMLVIENHRCLTTLFPEIKSQFSTDLLEFLSQLRHRAKLLDSSKTSIEETTTELLTIAKKQRKEFLEPHKGLLGPLKKLLQPDIGLSIFNNHIFTTTHTVEYAFGKQEDLSKSAFTFGKAVGDYIGAVMALFQIDERITMTKPMGLPGRIEMRDIKYKTLFTRCGIHSCHMQISAGLILILANLNFTTYILSGLLPASSHLLFRMKFITAFHANSSLDLLQQKLYTSDNVPPSVILFFNKLLGSDDSKWLKKRRPLRNLLTHYLPDDKLVSQIPSNGSYIDAIECYCGGLSFAEVNRLMDRYITNSANFIEALFNLRGDPFWYGKAEGIKV